MAQNWNLKEAYEAFLEGNKEAIVDIGHRFPLASNVISRLGSSEAVSELINALPDHVTVRKIETALKEGVSSDVEEEVEETETEAADVEDIDYAEMSGVQLKSLLRKHGVYKNCVNLIGKKKQDMLDYIAKYGLGDTEAADDDSEEEEVEETTSNPYEGKSAMELFKECKKRGIKAKPKQKAAFYVDLLVKADQESEEEEEADDDWADEEEEEKPTKKSKTSKKSKKVEEPVEEDEEDDEDDWNI